MPLYCVASGSLINHITPQIQRDALLEESLQLFMEVSGQINLGAICDKYYELHFYHGLVDLCVSAAQRLDPDNRAKSYVDNGKVVTDSKG